MTTHPFLEFAQTEDRMIFRARDATIEQSIGKIDLAEVTTTRLAPGSSALVDDRPISFLWGSRRPAAPHPHREFQGYLEGSTERTQGDGRSKSNDVMLRIFGVASVLRNKSSRVWQNATIPHVLADICDGYRLNLVVDESTTRWRSIKQDDESEWHFINRLADRLGWWVHLDGATLLVLDPDKILSRIPAVPTLTPSPEFKQETDDSPGFGKHNMAQRYAVWRSDDGTEFTFTSDDRVPVTGGEASTSKTIEEVKIDEAYTYDEAAALFNGVDRGASWYIRRRLRVEGRSDLRPLQPVMVRGPQVTQMDRRAPYEGWTQYDGMWLVESVSHRITIGAEMVFTSEVMLRRDARGSQPNVRQRQPGVVTHFEHLPRARLLSDHWVASHRIAS